MAFGAILGQSVDTFTKQETLTESTATLLGLTEEKIPDKAFLALFNQNIKIATGNYMGTGNYGIDNKNSLTFNFTPKIIMIIEDDLTNDTYNGISICWFVNNLIHGITPTTTNAVLGTEVSVLWSENKVEWYSESNRQPESSRQQGNILNKNYTYVALGV